jgi:uncharacterized repeat protein (TIGR04138 family)
MSESTISENQVEIRILELSDSLGFTKNTIDWILFGIKTLSDRKQQQAQDGVSYHISAKDICVALLRDVRCTCKDPVGVVLTRLKIKSSKDIGLIVYGLIEKNLLNASEDDSINDFDDLFDESNLGEFLANHGIGKSPINFQERYRQLMWICYSVGTLIVLFAYLLIVESTIARYGWMLAMAGFLMQFYKPPEPKRFQ